jgi:hemoglobin/transferrin/lactoferrin receptor protein
MQALGERYPQVADMYAQDAGVSEGYSIGEHTGMVLDMWSKQASPAQLDDLSSRLEMDVPRLMHSTLLLHDIGKPLAIQEGEKWRQHEFTLPIMADVLANSGSIFVQKSQLGGGSPIIRGFETNKVLLVVDGIRMNNAIYRGGHLQNSLTLDQANMDRVEIVFGPGSVMYGSDAIGGVMSFQTKKPVFSSSDQLLVRSSAYLRGFSAGAGYAANAQVNIGSKRFASLTSFSYAAYGDLRQGNNRSEAIGNLGYRPWYVAQFNGVDSMVVNADSSLQVGSGYKQYDV